MAYIIPTSAEALYQQVTTLDGRDYVLTFAWNQRDGHWYLDVADQDSSPIASGVRITVGVPLLGRCVDPRKPPGILAAEDTTGRDADPGFAELGARVQLVYFTAAEVAGTA